MLSPLLHSRCHALRSASPQRGRIRLFLKREDELGSVFCNGSKFRKYAALRAFLRSSGKKHVAVIASPWSSNLLAALSCLAELGIRATLFLCGDAERAAASPLYRVCCRLFLRDGETDIVWVPKAQWPQVDASAADWLSQHVPEHESYVLSEGASVWHAVPGMATLADSVCLNAEEIACSVPGQTAFSHIFVDAGTGFTAASLIAGHLLSYPKLVDSHIHVVSMVQLNHLRLYEFVAWMAPALDPYAIPDLSAHRVSLHRPIQAASFGAKTARVTAFVESFLFAEGILLDPIYSAKMVMTAFDVMCREQLEGNILLIHSGGILPSLLSHNLGAP